MVRSQLIRRDPPEGDGRRHLVDQQRLGFRTELVRALRMGDQSAQV